MDLPLPRAFSLIELAQEEETKEAMFRLYLVDRPNMDKKTFMTFAEYYDKYHKPKAKLDNRTDEEIMAEILAIEIKE